MNWTVGSPSTTGIFKFASKMSFANKRNTLLISIVGGVVVLFPSFFSTLDAKYPNETKLIYFFKAYTYIFKGNANFFFFLCSPAFRWILFSKNYVKKINARRTLSEYNKNTYFSLLL
jgi:hypothetical protein